MELLTIKEVCQLLRIKRCALYKLINLTRLPAFKIGRNWRFERQAIETWIKEQMK